MIDLDTTPARYRGTIEVYCECTFAASPKEFEWRWRCKSRNGQVLGHGEGYRRKGGALNAIDAMFGAKFTDEARRTLHTFKVMDHFPAVVPWRLVIHDRHGNIERTGAVY